MQNTKMKNSITHSRMTLNNILFYFFVKMISQRSARLFACPKRDEMRKSYVETTDLCPLLAGSQFTIVPINSNIGNGTVYVGRGNPLLKFLAGTYVQFSINFF
jgi:hypothetical protein